MIIKLSQPRACMTCNQPVKEFVISSSWLNHDDNQCDGGGTVLMWILSRTLIVIIISVTEVGHKSKFRLTIFFLCENDDWANFFLCFFLQSCNKCFFVASSWVTKCQGYSRIWLRQCLKTNWGCTEGRTSTKGGTMNHYIPRDMFGYYQHRQRIGGTT